MYYCFYIGFFSRHIRKRIRFTMFSWGRRAETRVSARLSARSRDFLVKILEENIIPRMKNLAKTRVLARVLVLLHQ